MRHFFKFILVILEIVLIPVTGYITTIFVMNTIKGPTFYLNKYTEFTVRSDANQDYIAKGTYSIVSVFDKTQKTIDSIIMETQEHIEDNEIAKTDFYLIKYTDENEVEQLDYVMLVGRDDTTNECYAKRVEDSEIRTIKISDIYGRYAGKINTPINPNYLVLGACYGLIIMFAFFICLINKRNKKFAW